MRTILAILAAGHLLAQVSISGPPSVFQGDSATYTATGGTPPYTWTMLSGSAGTISSSGVYTAPSNIASKQTINGCATPPNWIFNTRIDALDVHRNNPLWMSNVDSNYLAILPDFRLGNIVLSTDPGIPMAFRYTTDLSGTPFIFPGFPKTVSQSGSDVQNGLVAGEDNHYTVTYRDTCQQQENYQLYTPGLTVPGGAPPNVNSGAGVIYGLNNFSNPGYGTDAAELPLAPLTYHVEELLAAAAGNPDAIQHAARLTLDAASIDRIANIWPAQGNNTVGTTCQVTFIVNATGGNTVNYVSDGSAFGHFLPWAPGTIVTINGQNYAITANAGSTLTLNGSPKTQDGASLTQPASNCPPYGARFRLKSAFSFSFDGLCTTSGCRNVVNAIVRQLQRYGLILADIGTSWESSYDGGKYASGDIQSALFEVTQILTQANVRSSFEIVDESVLNTNQTNSGKDIRWLEAKLDSGIVTPDGAAVIQVADSAGHTASFDVALQGVQVGVQNPVEVVMPGARPIQFSPWVTGSTNTGYACSLSPSGGANGIITQGCLYTPPSRQAVSTRTDATVTVTAAADSAVTRTFQIVILPPSADGRLYISLGKAVPSSSYTDTAGNVWWNDIPSAYPYALFPLYNAYGVSGSWTGANSAIAPGIYTQGFMTSPTDIHLPIRVPNGRVTATVYLVSLLPGPNQAAFSFDCNGTRVKGWTDTFSYVGGVNTAGSVTCAETVTDGLIEPVIRWQGVSLQSNPCCSQPIYSAGGSDFLEVAGLVVCVSSYSTIGGRPRGRELEPCWVSAQQRASNPYQLPGILRADH